jgi:hypothetical protein
LEAFFYDPSTITELTGTGFTPTVLDHTPPVFNGLANLSSRCSLEGRVPVTFEPERDSRSKSRLRLDCARYTAALPGPLRFSPSPSPMFGGAVNQPGGAQAHALQTPARARRLQWLATLPWKQCGSVASSL